MSNPLESAEKHDQNMDGENIQQSDAYGVLPAIAGVGASLGLILFMFALADGFA